MSKPGENEADPMLPPAPPPYLLLLPRRRNRRLSTLFSGLLTLSLLAIAVFFLWPSDPDLSVARLRLDHVHVSAKPSVSLDAALALTLRVRNPDLFAMDYRSVAVSIGYRGRRLGSVTSEGGRVRARGVSFVDAELRLDGIQVLHDAFYLIEDVFRGSIPFDTVTHVRGVLKFFIFEIPIQGKIACGVHVNPANQTIARQDCYPE